MIAIAVYIKRFQEGQDIRAPWGIWFNSPFCFQWYSCKEYTTEVS